MNVMKISYLALASAALLATACNAEKGATNTSAAEVTAAAVPAPNNGDWSTVVSKTPEGGFVMGNPNAKVKLVPYAGGIAQFLTDANYSQQCFVTAEPLLAKKKNKPAASFLIADAGFNPYGTVVVARRQYIDKNPKQVRDLIEAIRDGWSDYLRAPESANTWMVKLNPAMDSETMKASAEVQKPFILAANLTNKELGKMSKERWATLVDQLVAMKLIKKKPAVEKLYENF